MTRRVKWLLALLLSIALSVLFWDFWQNRGVDLTCRDGFVYAGGERPLRITGTIAFHFSADLSGYASVSGNVDWQGKRYVLSRESRFRYASIGKNTVQLSSVQVVIDQRDSLPGEVSPDKLLESLFFRPPPQRLITIRRIANIWLIGNISSGVFACTG